jgi:hypothetical protein
MGIHSQSAKKSAMTPSLDVSADAAAKTDSAGQQQDQEDDDDDGEDVCLAVVFEWIGVSVPGF